MNDALDQLTQTDPLDALFWSATDYAREIAKVLRGLVKIDGDDILFTKDMTVANRIVCYFLAIRAMELMERRDTFEASPNDIEREAGLVGNSVRPILSKLVEKGIICKVREGVYKANTTHLHKTAVFLGAHYGRWQ